MHLPIFKRPTRSNLSSSRAPTEEGGQVSVVCLYTTQINIHVKKKEYVHYFNFVTFRGIIQYPLRFCFYMLGSMFGTAVAKCKPSQNKPPKNVMTLQTTSLLLEITAIICTIINQVRIRCFVAFGGRVTG